MAHHLQRILAVAALGLFALGVALPGCTSGTPAGTDGPGQLFWHVVDEPIDDISALTVTATAIRLRPCDETWSEYTITPTTFNLLELQQGKFLDLLSQLTLPAGLYCESRIVLDPAASVTLADGTVETLHIPSASSSGFKVKGTFPIDPSQATLVTVDFDAKKSLHRAGKKYILKPVIEIESVLQFPAPPPGSTATVLTPAWGGTLSAPTFELKAAPGAVTSPTLIWCMDDGVGAIKCGPDGTTFNEPISIALKASLTNIVFDDTKTVVMTQDSEVLYTVVDETNEWLYARASHFTGFAQKLLEAIGPNLYKKYVGEPVPMNVGKAADFRSTTVAKNNWVLYHFKKVPGVRQTFCVKTTGGNVDIYSSWVPFPTPNNNGTTLSGDPRFIAESDGNYECISLDIEKDGILYVTVFGRDDATFTPSLFVTDQKSNPSWLQGTLRWPLDSCAQITFPKYGPFNSPWGNGCSVNEPFFGGKSNEHKLHTAVDVACANGEAVRAVCTGPIKKVNSAGSEWGQYALQLCQIDATHSITVAYVHLQNVLVSAPDVVGAGDQIGEVFNVNVKGELDHLHYAICVGDCATAHQVQHIDTFDKYVREGVEYQRLNPDCHSNSDIYDQSYLPAQCFVAPYAMADGYCQ